MESLWIKKFEQGELSSPKKILEQQCAELNKLTNGIIIGRVSEYQGSIRNNDPLSSMSLSLAKTIVTKTNVQDELGEVNSNIFTYEFFITSKDTPKYKYRAFFMQYGISLYPVRIVLDMDIADEINPVDGDNENNYNLDCDDKENFIGLLSKILNSNKITQIINSLLTLNGIEDVVE